MWKHWQRVLVGVAVLALGFFVAQFTQVFAQNTNLFSQIAALQVNQPFPPSLVSLAESVDKRGQRQTYYYLSGNFVYPHFVELESGQVVHTAVYIDPAHSAEYAQKLEKSGKPEVVLQNTENERILGFPSKGEVYVVNAQKQPVVFEKMKPISERNIVAAYDSETVIAAADELDKSTQEQEQFLKYPNIVIKFAVQFYTAVLANPKLAMIVFGIIVAIVLLLQGVGSIRNSLKVQRDAEIAQLLEETAEINRQREVAAAVADTISVPTQTASSNTPAAPAFDVTSVEEATPIVFTPVKEMNQANPEEQQAIEAAALATYQSPDVDTLKQQAVHNPKLRNDLDAFTNTDPSQTTPITENTSDTTTDAVVVEGTEIPKKTGD